MTDRMTAQRLSRLIADGDTAAVRTAVDTRPRMLTSSVERTGSAGWTPLHLAVAAGHPAVVEVLVAAGADATARTEDGHTPLHVALQHAPDLVELLCSLGAPVDAASAAHLGDADRLAGELDGGERLTDPATGVGLLVRAASGGSTATVQFPLDRGADPDDGSLHAPAAVVRALPGAGADVNATTSDGASPLDISRVAAARGRAGGGRAPGHEALTELLVAAGATN